MRKLFVAVGLFIAGLAGSVQAQFCPGVSPWVFDDVLASDPFCPNVTWMALNSITLGCKTLGPNDRLYCPNDNVTRKSMAAFMNRLGTATTSTLSGNYFKQGGNAFGTTAKLGTTNVEPLELLVVNARALRIEPPGYAGYSTSPNIIGGCPVNTVAAGTSGATIAGGGSDASFCGASGTSPCLNAVTDQFGTVGGGWGNTAGHFGTVAGGQQNTASGSGSTVPGGANNIASGIGSFAAGYKAVVTHNFSFLWCDGRACNSQEDYDFIVVAKGGIKFYAQDGAGGCILIDPAGSGWQCASDRKLKENFATLDTRDVLRRVSEMPITRWNVKSSPGIAHIGPVAQDFYAAFGLGSDDLHIGSSDISGVALAAIQGLNARVEEQQREIADLRERVSVAESLRGELAGVRAELAGLLEARSQNTARAPAADGFRADAAR